MPFKKGKSGNPNGRPKGSQNKITRDAVAFVWEALELAGGAQALADRPDILFNLIGKLLPQVSNVSLDAKHQHNGLAEDDNGVRLLSEALKATGTDGNGAAISFPKLGKE